MLLVSTPNDNQIDNASVNRWYLLGLQVPFQTLQPLLLISHLGHLLFAPFYVSPLSRRNESFNKVVDNL